MHLKARTTCSGKVVYVFMNVVQASAKKGGRTLWMSAALSCSMIASCCRNFSALTFARGFSPEKVSASSTYLQQTHQTGAYYSARDNGDRSAFVGQQAENDGYTTYIHQKREASRCRQSAEQSRIAHDNLLRINLSCRTANRPKQEVGGRYDSRQSLDQFPQSNLADGVAAGHIEQLERRAMLRKLEQPARGHFVAPGRVERLQGATTRASYAHTSVIQIEFAGSFRHFGR